VKATLESKGAAFIATVLALNCRKEADELLFAVLPGSEQFRLQQTRAIEAPGWLLRAFLQHSGSFSIGPSCWCAPTPTAAVNMTIVSNADVIRFRITA